MKLILVMLSASLVLAAPAAAQMAPPRAERPYRGLFGGGVGNAEQLLTLNLSLGEGYDDNVLANTSGVGDVPISGPNSGTASSFTSIAAGLAYNLTRKRVGINASVATSARYHPSVESTQFVSSQSGSFGAFGQLAKNTRVVGSHTTSFQPYLSLGLFPPLFEVPGEAVPPPQEYGVNNSEYFSHTSSIAMTQGLGRRTSLNLRYDYRFDDFQGVERDLSGPTASGRLTVQLSKGLGVYGGYRYTGVTYGTNGDRPVSGKGVDAGIDFNRPLSFSRRTTLSFATGSTAVSEADRTIYRITGHALLNHEIRRSWNASLAYARDVNFIETFSEPVFADSVTFGVGGMVSRHLKFQSSIAASYGAFAFTGAGTGYDTYTGNAGITYGLTRYLGVGVYYAYYYYYFDQGAPLPIGFSRQMDRQSVQANLNLWVPLMHRARRPDAAR